MSEETAQSASTVVRILGIAPYDGMKTVMEKLAQERSDIQLDVFTGDLQQGVEIARHNFQSDYDVIISRGGTAQLIGQTTHIPVIEVGLSVYDILRAIKLAENYTDQYAIVGFPSITGNAHLLCDLLQYQIDIFTIRHQDEAQETLRRLKDKGYRMVLCDMISNTTAKRLGLNTILITSGQESISKAFDQAVRVCSSYTNIKAEKKFYAGILQGGNDEIVVLKHDGNVFFSTIDEKSFPSLHQTLCHELPAVLSKKNHKFFKNLDGTLFSFTCKAMTFLGEDYGVFYFSATSVPFATSKYGIQYSNLQDTENQFFNSFYSIADTTEDMRTTIENINQTNFPVMLIGENGSGKDHVVRTIYSRSSLRANPLITINCPLINDKSWGFLTKHYNSPFNDNNNTIYLKDITALPADRRQHLLSIIIDTNLYKRNRLLFSCILPAGGGVPPAAMEFVNRLSCLTIHLPPLRSRPEEIPALCSLCLNSINVSMVNQIIGLQPEALKLLQNYSWPYNYTQFRRIINELALVTATPYIQAEHVVKLLEKEQALLGQPSPGEKDSQPGLDLNQTLSEITRDIVKLVLDETGGNQTAAAKRLGIGRSTLWRYLKE